MKCYYSLKFKLLLNSKLEKTYQFVGEAFQEHSPQCKNNNCKFERASTVIQNTAEGLANEFERAMSITPKMEVYQVQAWIGHIYPAIEPGLRSKYLINNAHGVALERHFGYKDDIKSIFKLRDYMEKLGHTFVIHMTYGKYMYKSIYIYFTFSTSI